MIVKMWQKLVLLMLLQHHLC